MTDASPSAPNAIKLELEDGSKKKYALTLEVDKVTAEPVGHEGPRFEIVRFDFPTRLDLPTFGKVAILILRDGKTNVAFQLKDQPRAIVEAWLGPPTRAHLRVELGKRLGWTVTLGAVFMLTGLGQDANGAIAIVDLWSFALGFGLSAIGMFSKLVPHRVFFLLDSAWFVPLVATTAQRLLEEPGFGWAAILALQLWIVASGIKRYRKFAVLREDVEATGAT